MSLNWKVPGEVRFSVLSFLLTRGKQHVLTSANCMQNKSLLTHNICKCAVYGSKTKKGSSIKIISVILL